MNLKKCILNKKLCFPIFSILGFVGSIVPYTIFAQSSEVIEEKKIEKVESIQVEERKSETAIDVSQVREKEFTPPKYAVLPTGKTLPKGIFRIDFPTAYTFGNFGFDEKGVQKKNGMSFSRWMTGALIQYGISKNVSIGVGIPYVLSNNVSLDGGAFASTDFYQKYYNKFVQQLSAALAGTPYCGSIESCTTFITSGNGGSLASGTTIILATGEPVNLSATTPIKNQINNIILAAAKPSSGATGIGDIQLGILWNIISDETPFFNLPLFFSLGGGLRLPTGQFDLASAMRATGGDGTLITGGGTYDAVFRWNLDYISVPGVILSWQHQIEYSLTSANLGRTSMLNPSQKNQADATALQGGLTGDEVGNTLRFSRKGIRQIGFLQGAWGVGNVNEDLKWLGIYSQAKYNMASQAYLNNMPIYAMGDQFFLKEKSLHSDYGLEQYYAAVLGTKFSGLPYMFPVECSLEFEYPFAGKNRIVSPMNALAMVSVYF